MLFETTKVMTDFAKNKADEVFTSLKAKEKSNIAHHLGTVLIGTPFKLIGSDLYFAKHFQTSQ